MESTGRASLPRRFARHADSEPHHALPPRGTLLSYLTQSIELSTRTPPQRTLVFFSVSLSFFFSICIQRFKKRYDVSLLVTLAAARPDYRIVAATVINVAQRRQSSEPNPMLKHHLRAGEIRSPRPRGNNYPENVRDTRAYRGAEESNNHRVQTIRIEPEILRIYRDPSLQLFPSLFESSVQREYPVAAKLPTEDRRRIAVHVRRRPPMIRVGRRRRHRENGTAVTRKNSVTSHVAVSRTLGTPQIFLYMYCSILACKSFCTTIDIRSCGRPRLRGSKARD